MTGARRMEQDEPESGLHWLYVDFNSYFASVEQQMQPHLRGKPVAVVPVETDFTCAIAASYEAKAFGIRTGTPIREARQKCPALICVLARHDVYVDVHHRIIREINRHIPVTAVCSIDEVACRLLRNEAAESVATRIAHSVKQGLQANIGAYISCSIGIAPNRYLAKVATDMQKPNGLTILRPEHLPQRLFTLALRDFPGIGRNMERRLHQVGIMDAPSLLALGPDRMRAIWGGIWGDRMWHLLRGKDLAEIETQRRSIGHSHVMAPEFRHPAQAIHVARRLTLKAASRLRRMEYYASDMAFSARMESGSRLEDAERCWRAQDNDTFLKMLDRIWSRTVGRDGQGRVKQLSVVLHGLCPAAAVQPDLFEAGPGHLKAAPGHAVMPRARSENLSRAMDRLNHRFGRDTILIGMLPSQGRSFAGTKVAFTRIPDREEFVE